jgi:methionyl-tRNA formyltransferase
MSGARLAVFTLVEWSFAVVRDWAAQAGHEIALLVTLRAAEGTPGGLAQATLTGSDGAVIVVPQVTGAAAALADLDVDLAVVFTFRRVPEAVASLPRHGTVNVHPALLPAFRGPNGYRALYAGAPEIGATLHHLTPAIDAGPILAQASEPVPEDVDPQLALEAIGRVARAVLDAGVPRALAGDPGEPQDERVASDAPAFTDDELKLDLETGSRLFQCRFSALCLAGRQAEVVLGEEPQPLRAVRRLAGVSAPQAGVIALSSRRAVVALADGSVLELELGKLPY